jgi:hypothetical protein
VWSFTSHAPRHARGLLRPDCRALQSVYGTRVASAKRLRAHTRLAPHTQKGFLMEPKLKALDEQVIVITGASSGIGLAAP